MIEAPITLWSQGDMEQLLIKKYMQTILGAFGKRNSSEHLWILWIEFSSYSQESLAAELSTRRCKRTQFAHLINIACGYTWIKRGGRRKRTKQPTCRRLGSHWSEEADAVLFSSSPRPMSAICMECWCTHAFIPLVKKQLLGGIEKGEIILFGKLTAALGLDSSSFSCT